MGYLGGGDGKMLVLLFRCYFSCLDSREIIGNYGN